MTGCAVSSTHPLADPGEAVVDERLLGQWMLKESDGSSAHEIVGKTRGDELQGMPAGIITLNSFKVSAERQIDWQKADARLFAFTAKVHGRHYLHIIGNDLLDSRKFPQWDAKAIDSYLIAKYEIAGDRLTVIAMSPEAAAAAVESGKLGGKVEREKPKNHKVDNNSATGKLRRVKLTDSTEALVRYLQNGGDKSLFDQAKSITYTRAKW